MYEVETAKAASILLLPQLSGIELFQFELTDDNTLLERGEPANVNVHGSHNSVGQRRPLMSSDVDMITRIPNGKDVKLILLFLTDNSSSEFADALLRRYGPDKTVIAGGYGYEILTDDGGSRSAGTFCCCLLLFAYL